MAALVSVPDLGREMLGGIVAEWYRPDGAEVSPGELVCRIECEYVAFDLEAEHGGLLRHRRPAGSIENKGAVLGAIVAPGEPLPSEEALRAAEAVEAGEPDTVRQLPDRAERLRERECVDEAPADVEKPPVEREGDHAFLPHSHSVVQFSRRQSPGSSQAEPLPEPGGAIPGLPLWEEDGLKDASEATVRPAPTDVTRGDMTLRGTAGVRSADEPEERFARIATEAASTSEVLSARVFVSWARAAEAVEALAEEWHPFGPRPLIEDLVLRALARALSEAGVEPGVAAVVIVEPEADRSFAVAEPLEGGFRAMVRAREERKAPFERADWGVVSLLPIGVEHVEPRLSGWKLSFGLGASRDGIGTITMRYDSATFGEGDAGRILARVRSLVENPYRLWG